MFALDSMFTFLSFQETYALVGVSRNKNKFGYQLYNELKKRGYQVYGVNPLAPSIDGEQIYASLADVPKTVNRVIILIPKAQSAAVIQQAIDLKMTHIWLQRTSETPAAIELGKHSSVEFIYGFCVMMVAEPVTGMHAFHRSILQLIGSFPKEKKLSALAKDRQ